MFVKLRGILNGIGNNCEIAFTIHNRSINMDDFKDRVLLKERGDKLDWLRREWNKVVLDRIREGKNGIEKCKYLTLGLHAGDVRKAAAAFSRLDRELDAGFRKLSSEARVIPIAERLEILHDIYRPMRRGEFLTRTREADSNGVLREKADFDFDNMRGMGLSVQDVIAPTSVQYFPRHMRLGKKYVRVMQIVNLPNALTDEFFVRLSDVNFNMVVTVNIRPILAKEANAMIHRNIVLAQTAKSDEMKNLISAGLLEEMVNPDTEERVEKAKALRSDMMNDDEKLFKATYTLMFFADSEEELQEHTDTVFANCNAAVVGARIMVDRQEEGFNTTLPLESDTARKMLSNCNFIQMLNQAPNDRLQLMQLLNLSESQTDVITSAPRGQGLIFTGTNCVPFASSFPKTTKDGGVHPIYRVLTSNMKELREYEEMDKRREITLRKAEKKREMTD